MDMLGYFMWTAFCASFLFGMTSEQEMVGDSECKDSDTCFTLYKAIPGFTRAEADTYCRGIGRSLAVIPDEDTQDVISRLAGRGTGTDQLAWVGGLRGRGTKWKDPGGALIQSLGRLADSNDPGRWCSGVKLDTFRDYYKVFPLNCSYTLGYRAVCENGMSCSTDTDARKFDIVGVCHVVSDVMFTSWLAAQDHCERTHTGGNLAFSVIDKGSYFTGTYEKSEGYFWTGIQRRSWVWKTSTEALVTYTNWLPSEPGASDTGECLVVDLTQNGDWKVSDCDVTRGYSICESPPITTSTTAAATTTATVTTTMETLPLPTATTGVSATNTQTSDTTAMDGGSTTVSVSDSTTYISTENTTIQATTEKTSVSKSTALEPPVLYYVIGGCAAGLLLIMIITIASVCSKRRSKRRQSDRSRINISYAAGPSIGLNGQTSHEIKTAKEKTTSKPSSSGTANETEIAIDAKPAKRSNKTIMEKFEEENDEISSIRSDDGQKDEVEKFTILSEKPTTKVDTLQKGQYAKHGSSTSISNPTYDPSTTAKPSKTSNALDESPYDIAEVVDPQKLAKSLDSDEQMTKAEELISTGGASRQEPIYDAAAEVRMRDRSSSSRDSDLEIVDNALYVPS